MIKIIRDIARPWLAIYIWVLRGVAGRHKARGPWPRQLVDPRWVSALELELGYREPDVIEQFYDPELDSIVGGQDRCAESLSYWAAARGPAEPKPPPPGRASASMTAEEQAAFDESHRRRVGGMPGVAFGDVTREPMILGDSPEFIPHPGSKKFGQRYEEGQLRAEREAAEYWERQDHPDRFVEITAIGDRERRYIRARPPEPPPPDIVHEAITWESL